MAYVKKVGAERKRKPGAGRPATGRKVVHSFNCSLDMDVYEWLTANKGSRSMTSFINQLIKEKAEL